MFKEHLVIVSIKYNKNYKVKLIGFSDNDWVGCVDNMMGTSKYIFFQWVQVYLWFSKKQQMVV